MKTQYKIGLDGSGIDEFIDGINQYERWLKERSAVLLQRLADEGYQITAAGFEGAQYDGTNDAQVTVEDRGATVKAIVALGETVLFIEFGTGITYPDNHPEAAKNGMVRGQYGHGLGKMKKGWRYPAERGAGSAGFPDPDHEGYIHTYGNPANMPMYNAVKELRERLPALAREVFKT